MVGEGTPPPGHQTSRRPLVLLWEQHSALARGWERQCQAWLPASAAGSLLWLESMASPAVTGEPPGRPAGRAATPKPDGRRKPRLRLGTQPLAAGARLRTDVSEPQPFTCEVAPTAWCLQVNHGMVGQRPGPGPAGQVRGGEALAAPAGPGTATFCFVSREPD